MCVLNIYIYHQSQSPICSNSLESKPGGEPEYLSTFKLIGSKWFQARTRKQLIIGTLLSMLIVLSAVALTIALLTTQSRTKSLGISSEELEINKPNNDPEDFGIVPILSRREWIAEPPTNTTALSLPVSNVLITETETPSCNSSGDCVFIVRHLQTSDKEGYSLWDIKYNFLVGGDGNVYEGRGWKVLSASVPDCNVNSLGIAFIGSFLSEAVPEKQVYAARRLIGMGVKLGHIKRDYKVATSAQILGESAGSSENLNEVVKTWPHWTNVNFFLDYTLKQEFCNY